MVAATGAVVIPIRRAGRIWMRAGSPGATPGIYLAAADPAVPVNPWSYPGDVEQFTGGCDVIAAWPVLSAGLGWMRTTHREEARTAQLGGFSSDAWRVV